MLEEKLTITEQQALDIAENPADITPEQLDSRLSDADLRKELDELKETLKESKNQTE